MCIKFSIDNQSYTSKPNRSEAARIQTRVGQNAVDVEIAQLPDIISRVGEQGCTIAPSTFKDGKRNKENFIQQQLFMLDFDNADPKRGMITPDEFMDRCSTLGIPVTAIYETFSSTEDQPRFRVILLNDAPITDKRLVADMNRMLGAIFPEADKCWKNYAGMYFGGKKLVYLNDDLTDTINIPRLVDAHEKYITFNDKGGKHCREKLRRFWKDGKPYIASGDAIENMPDAVVVEGNVKNGGKLPSSILLYTNIDSGKIPPFYEVLYPNTQQRTKNSSTAPSEQNTINQSSVKRNKYRSNLLKKLPSVCQLFDEFLHGKRELTHEELFGLATNVVQIEGGRKLFLNTIDQYPHLHANDDPRKEWARQISYIKDAKYQSEGCDRFCPYKDVCHHLKNILHTAAPEFMEKIDGYSLGLKSLDEVRKETEKAIRKACEADDNMVRVINSGTAVGKTTILISMVSEYSDKQFLIAEPTILMKHELLERLHEASIDAMETPSLDELEDELSDELFSKLKKMRDRGEKTTPYISKLINEGKCSKSDVTVLHKFLKQKQKIKNFKGTIVTTHRYLSVCDEKWLRKFNNIIVDEDILYKLIATNHDSVPMRKLEKIAKATSNPHLKGKINQLKKAMEDGSGYVKLDSIYPDDDNISANLKAFCEAEHFYVRSPDDEPNLKEETVSYVVPLKLPKDMKLIVVSATANEEIYEQYFGSERVKFKMCNRAPYEGTLKQYYGLSMSRNCLKDHPGMIKYLQKHFDIPDANVITYLSEDTGDLHYGNAEGSNMLEGQDILVVGSAYQPPFIYVLATAALGFPISDTEISNQRVEYNGYRFKYQAFTDDDLRTVQFWMTESELEQAVGRARLLWHNCTVYLFSNFPVQQAEMIDGYTVYGLFVIEAKSTTNKGR